MDAEKPSFILTDLEDRAKPLPYSLGYRNSSKSTRTKLPNIYPKFEIEFYDVVKTCAEYIDKIVDLELRIKYTNDLSRIFILRHKGSAMKLFKELFNITITQKGGHHG